jgi:transposase
MVERSGDATALLGMEGFVVLSSTEEEGELYLLVETRADVVGCPHCGVPATGHGRSVVQVRDLPAGGRPVRLVWRKRRWTCLDSDCPAKTFTEQSPLVEGGLSRRAAVEICRRSARTGVRWLRWPGTRGWAGRRPWVVSVATGPRSSTTPGG